MVDYKEKLSGYNQTEDVKALSALVDAYIVYNEMALLSDSFTEKNAYLVSEGLSNPCNFVAESKERADLAQKLVTAANQFQQKANFFVETYPTKAALVSFVKADYDFETMNAGAETARLAAQTLEQECLGE